MSLTESNPTLIVAGGGTGGHVLAGVAIADSWKKKYPGSKIIFVGARGGIEEKLVPRAGYPLELLLLGSLKGVSWKKRIRTLVLLPFALVRSLAILMEHRPKAVIGVGGYASGPLVLMARFIGWSWGGRVAILEQNAVPGMTNKILSVFSHTVLAAFPGIESQFPQSVRPRVHVSGNPVRAAIKPMKREASGPFTVFIFGGSQGAQGINSLVLDALPHLKDLFPKLKFIHQTGEKDFERVKAGYAPFQVASKVEKFIYEMPETYAESSLLICRAGSSTLSEVAAVGRASVLIPFPQASDNHQEKNARLFSDQGAAVLLIQSQAKGSDLAALIRGYLEKPETLESIERKVSSFYKPDAASDVVEALS